jgi:hypothetical protein
VTLHRRNENGARRAPFVTAVSEPQVGIEPTTARLRIECSTPELLWQAVVSPNALARTRTATPCGTTPSRWRVYQFHHQGKPTCSYSDDVRYQLSISAFRNSEHATLVVHPEPNRVNCELSDTGATGFEPATSRVTVECSNQAELRPPMYCRSNGGTDARCRSFHRSTVPPFHRSTVPPLLPFHRSRSP